ncbi:uncharacterized protein LOC105316640 [Rhizophagus irregularis DAOM 181602=DAOM 197198]|nr:uncharacterized protein LOC105316640 [Rhizophagus irregularis DAOM 181602=DAOM 197198]
MDNKFISRDTLQKRKARENETSSQRETRLAKQREITRQKRARENANAEEREQKYQDSGTDGAEGDDAEDDDAEDGADTHTDAGVLGEFERNLLKKFYNKRECRRCHKEKQPKKFSKDNNMDPGKVPDKLRDLTEIEKMLVAQVFPVMSVYRLCGEFASKLPRHPSLLDMLVIRHQSVSNAEAFRDFKVRRDKVIQALIWLKQNNRYYANVIIDHEILQSLPIDGTIDDQLQDINEDIDYDESENDVITHTFILLSPSANREDTAIRNTLNRIQNENHHIMWSQINGNPVNEFQTPGDIKPAKYFRHLLQYKDRRFTRHARWWYFALNSQMRWRLLQEGKVIMRFGEGLRESRQFCAANLHWPKLHQLMPSNGNRKTSAKRHHQNIVDNPHIADWFFYKQFEIFFNDILKKQWDLKDWWFRIKAYEGR